MEDVQGVMEDTQFDYERRFSVFPFTLSTFLPLYTKRKDNGEEFFRRDCMRKFSYHETLL